MVLSRKQFGPLSPEEALKVGQTPLWLPARVLRAMAPADLDWRQDKSEAGKEQLWEEKLSETKQPPTAVDSWGDQVPGAGLHDDIKRQGRVNTPVNIQGPLLDHRAGTGAHLLLDGHHRVAAAHDIDPNMEVPVTYDLPPFYGSSSGSGSDNHWRS